MPADMVIRKPESIYQATGEIEKGTFYGRWHFAFDEYFDPKFERFGPLRVFNDDTLSPGAVWPLHPHRQIEVVTYCAEGEFRHADERGYGGVLKKGHVQHTTVGRGMYHSEINNLPDKPMRFIQMWFLPHERDAKPHYEQKAVERADRTNCLLPLVWHRHPGALDLLADARVFSAFLETGKAVEHALEARRGAYLYVLEGGPVRVNTHTVQPLGAAMAHGPKALAIDAKKDAEVLLVDVLLA